SHMILQVQVQEAVAQETDTTVDRLTTALRGKNVHYDEVRRVDDRHILVRNIDPSQYSVLSDIVGTQYNNVWDTAPAAGEANSYTLTLRPGAVAAIEEDRKSTRLNSSHVSISYAVFCLKKKKSHLLSVFEVC